MIRFPVDCKKNKLPSRQSGKLFIYEILYFKIHFILQCIFLFLSFMRGLFPLYFSWDYWLKTPIFFCKLFSIVLKMIHTLFCGCFFYIKLNQTKPKFTLCANGYKKPPLFWQIWIKCNKTTYINANAIWIALKASFFDADVCQFVRQERQNVIRSW